MMSDEEVRGATEAMLWFESTLEDAVLRAFARGAKIEGDWRIDASVAGAPSWLVTVSRIEPSGDGGYESTAIDEGLPGADGARSPEQASGKRDPDGT